MDSRSFALIIATAAGGWGLYEWFDPADFKPPAGFSAFAPLYILAQAIERLIEPFSKILAKAPDEAAVIAWGIASGLAILACGAFGIRLLSAIGFDVPALCDIAITGLAVGSGTKPLHDLISNIQKSKETKTTPPGVVPG